jgi:riboflavin synthase
MFTGIVTDIGSVKAIKGGAEGKRLTIETRLPAARLTKGASVACAGVCLTVTHGEESSFVVDVSPETLRTTHIGTWKKKTRLNLEPSLRLGEELGGHLVSGHVDGVAVVEKILSEGENFRATIRAPKKLVRFIAPKGSVTLDGVSLTVNKVKGTRFTVNIIPHTWRYTTLGTLRVGTKLHLEVDMLARYVARQMKIRKK